MVTNFIVILLLIAKFNLEYRCIATLAGNFPFALGAATFGNVVYEDRLLYVSSDKSVCAYYGYCQLVQSTHFISG